MKINVKKNLWFGSYDVSMNDSGTVGVIKFGKGNETFTFEMPYACLEQLHSKIGELLPILHASLGEHARTLPGGKIE